MSFLGKVLEGVKTIYSEINPATLTGAIDVIVVQQKDGSFQCSPFHVRFGKMGVLRSKEKVVDIEINGEPVDIHMKLGESGEAFFVEEIPPAEECPSYLVTSPIPPETEDENFSSTHEPYRARASSESCAHEKLVKFRSKGESRSDGDVLLPSELETYNFDTGSRTSVLSEIKEVANEHVTVTSVTETLVGKRSEDAEEVFAPQEAPVAGEQLKVFKAETVKSGDILGPFKPIQQPTVGAQVDLETQKSVVKRRKKKRSTKKRNQRIRFKKTSASSSEEACEPSPSNSETSDELIVLDDEVEKDSSAEVEAEEKREVTEPSNVGLPEPREITDWSALSRGGGKDFHFFSDTDMYSPNISRPGTPVLSDTEYEKQAASQERPSIAQTEQPSWHWGELPTTPRTTPMRPAAPKSEDTEVKHDSASTGGQTVEDKKDDQANAQRSVLSSMFSLLRQTKKIRHDPLAAGGVYLDDLNLNEMDPEVAAIYFPNALQDIQRQGLYYRGQHRDDDVESGHGPSLPHSPSSFSGFYDRTVGVDSDSEEGRHPCRTRPNLDIVMSLCGGLEDLAEPPEDLFLQSMITFDDLAENPKVIDNPALVIRIGNKYYNRAAALPIIMSLVCFQRSLPRTVIDSLVQENMTKPREEKKRLEQQRSRSWFLWGRGAETKKSESEQPIPKKSETERASDSGKEDSLKKDTTSDDLTVKSQDRSPAGSPKKEVTVEKPTSEPQVTTTVSVEVEVQDLTQTPVKESRTEKCKKSLRLSSEQIQRLNLMEGANEVVFSVTTAYQGTTRCKCYIYLWRWDDKVVVSDIDGTITKSDVLGHILPIVGRNWAQGGVAQLFTKICENGYRILYLSARAIGQAQITRDYLKSLKQGDLALPDGPLLLNPTSLISALHREVIERKPEEFKIACLKDIQSLFPADSNPFYAGYGNRVNDIWAYTAIGINLQRIFTINPKGELKRGYTQTFNSSHSNYTVQSTLVDHVFPPLRRADNLEHACAEYSHFNYWKEPVPEIDNEILEAIGGDKTKK